MQKEGGECKGKEKKRANVRILYLKCHFFSKTRAFFPKRRAYFLLNCHQRNCIFMHIARAQVSVSGGSPAGPPVQSAVQRAVQPVVQDNSLIISHRCKKCKQVHRTHRTTLRYGIIMMLQS